MNAPVTALELLTTEEMGRADRLAAVAGVASLTLMENAGRAVASEAMRMVPAGARVAVVCGPGNNGGDGFVAARRLAQAGYGVRLALLGEPAALRADAAAMAGRWTGPTEPWTRVAGMLGWCDLVIDAMLGAGLTRPLRGEAAAAVELLNASGKPVLAVDVPSGLDGTTGAATGPVVQATRTVTFFRRKPGHLLMPGARLCGPVVLTDIGIPAAVLDEIGPRTLANGAQRATWAGALAPDVETHKYARGHAVVVSGPPTATGAARLGARGALRAGAGLVSIACAPEAAAVNAAHLTAVMVKPFAGPEGLSALLADRRLNAVLIGPGLGTGPATRALVEAALRSAASITLDADALTAFAGEPAALWRLIAARRTAGAAGRASDAGDVVLTPHEGEAKRLLGVLPGSRLDRARAAAATAGAVVLLKGPDTVVAAPDGMAAINENAPPWLATAGSGDVLAGIVAGLLAQGMPAFEAACAAVWLHGECGALAGPGLIAEDLPEALPQVLGRLLHAP